MQFNLPVKSRLLTEDQTFRLDQANSIANTSPAVGVESSPAFCFTISLVEALDILRASINYF